MQEYRIYRKRKIVTKSEFFTGNYNFVGEVVGELIATGITAFDDEVMNIFALYNRNPRIIESDDSLLLSGYWMETKEIDDDHFTYATETDFQEVADDLGIEE